MAKRTYSDSEIVHALRAQSDQWSAVMNYFYAAYWPLARQLVTSKGGAEMDAQDLFHDAICVLRDAVLQGRFQADKPIRPYFQRILNNLWNDALRRKYRHAPAEQLPESSDDATPLDLLIDRESGSLLEDIFGRLGAKCAELLRLRVLYKLPLRDIALRIGLASEDAAKMKHHRCKGELKRLLAQQPELLNRLKGT